MRRMMNGCEIFPVLDVRQPVRKIDYTSRGQVDDNVREAGQCLGSQERKRPEENSTGDTNMSQFVNRSPCVLLVVVLLGLPACLAVADPPPAVKKVFRAGAYAMNLNPEKYQCRPENYRYLVGVAGKGEVSRP